MLAALFALSLIANVVNYLIRLNTLIFQDNFIEGFKTDSMLSAKYRAYSDHELSYSTSELDSDNLRFELIIFGAKGYITYSGYAKRASKGE
ncbi:hypothetical protein GCM10011325_37010 [Dyadobacter sediminis]|nr:hypothetical protein GCM10011325_37010 [Dyadobacter sediminis]